MKIVLTHHCFKKGCQGFIGDVIEVEKALALEMIGRGGAVEAKATAKAVPQSVPVMTSAVVAPDENAAESTDVPPAKRGPGRPRKVE